MTIPKFIKISCLLLCLIVFYDSPCAGSDFVSRLYSLPLAELEAIVSDWLIRSGFEIQRTRLKMGDVRLTITRPAEKWQILLKPNSALITEIHAGAASGAAQQGATIDRMATFIDGYIQAPTDQKEISNQFIPPEILSQIGNVVCLKTKSNNKASQHSGFVVDTQGLVLSTIHDVEAFHDIKVTLYDGREITGNVIKKDITLDLALIDIGSGEEDAVSLAEGRNLLGMGERVYSVGCPMNLVGSVFSGVINGPPRRVNELTYWQVNMEIHPGSSGSPVFDVQGNLVGIVKGRFRGTKSIGFLIPLETIIAFVKGP
ncbi:MAG: trypsin-like peptidase domain-containing protein [bacterium]|nr:trypsin-like peptidase domain-containing protein [bacterium]